MVQAPLVLPDFDQQDTEFRPHTVQAPTPEGFTDVPGYENVSLALAMAGASRETGKLARYSILRIVDIKTGAVVAVYVGGALLSGASKSRLIELEQGVLA